MEDKGIRLDFKTNASPDYIIKETKKRLLSRGASEAFVRVAYDRYAVVTPRCDDKKLKSVIEAERSVTVQNKLDY